MLSFPSFCLFLIHYILGTSEDINFHLGTCFTYNKTHFAMEYQVSIAAM